MSAKHAGNAGTTPFYVNEGDESPEYDQGDSVIVWYDDPIDLAKDRDKLRQQLAEAEAEIARLKDELADVLKERNDIGRRYEREMERADNASHQLSALTTAFSALMETRREHAKQQRKWAESGVVFNPITLEAQADTNEEVADELGALLDSLKESK